MISPSRVLSEIVSGSHVLFVSFRLNHKKKDGVSLEVLKWVDVLHDAGAHIFYYSGENSSPLPRFVTAGREFRRVHFLCHDIVTQREDFFHRGYLGWDDLRKLMEDEKAIRADLAECCVAWDIEFVIAENILAYPGNIALSLSTVNVCNDLGLKLIAHNHDHWFERARFRDRVTYRLGMLLNQILSRTDYLVTMTINTAQARHLQTETDPQRFGREGEVLVVPNLMDFDNNDEPEAEAEEEEKNRILRLRRSSFRSFYGIGESEFLVLLPVRPVPRKELHLAIDVCAAMMKSVEIVGESGGGDFLLSAMVSHPAGDEGLEYWEDVVAYAKEKGVRLIYKPEIDERKEASEREEETTEEKDGLFLSMMMQGEEEKPEEENTRQHKKKNAHFFTLEDSHIACDVVLYTSSLEGWGNALIEAIYYRVPVIINPYSVFIEDIRPKGIRCAELSTRKVTRTFAADASVCLEVDTLAEDPIPAIVELLRNKEEIIQSNVEISRVHFSYDTLRNLLILALLRLNKMQSRKRGRFVGYRSLTFGDNADSPEPEVLLTPSSTPRNANSRCQRREKLLLLSPKIPRLAPVTPPRVKTLLNETPEEADDAEEEEVEEEERDGEITSPLQSKKILSLLRKSFDRAKHQHHQHQHEGVSPFVYYKKLLQLQREEEFANGVTMLKLHEQFPSATVPMMAKDLGMLSFLGYVIVKKSLPSGGTGGSSSSSSSPLYLALPTREIVEPEKLLVQEFELKRDRSRAKRFLRKQLVVRHWSEGTLEWDHLRHGCRKFLARYVAQELQKDPEDLTLEDFHHTFPRFSNQSLQGLFDWFGQKYRLSEDPERCHRKLMEFLFSNPMSREDDRIAFIYFK